MTTYPVAYVRRSSPDEKDGAGDISRESQENAIRTLAQREGINGDLRWFTDWGRSGRGDKIHLRGEYAEMLEDVQAGRVSVILCYALDRLNRDLGEHRRLMKAVADHKVKIVTLLEGVISEANPAAWWMVTSIAAQAEYTSRVYSQRAKEAIERRRARGDWLGQAQYGFTLGKVDGVVVQVPNPDQPVDQVLAVYKAQRNVYAAVKELNRLGIPTRYGKTWSDSALRKVLEQHGVRPSHVDKLRRDWHSGELKPPSVLSKLVRCHCGAQMTGIDSRGTIYCWKGITSGKATHGKWQTRQQPILDWLKEKTADLERVLRSEATYSSTDVAARRAATQEALRRLGVSYRAGTLTDLEFEDESKRLQEDLADLEEVEGAYSVHVRRTGPPILWDDPARLSADLHAVVKLVRLGPDMKPASVEWRGMSSRAARYASEDSMMVPE
jgi:DNA invertase Pin-like site-specific DNA recombinase